MSPQKESWFNRFFGAFFPQTQAAVMFAAKTQEEEEKEEKLTPDPQAEEDLRVFFKRKALRPVHYKLQRDANGNWRNLHEPSYSSRDRIYTESLSYPHAIPPTLPLSQLYKEEKDLRFFFEADCPKGDPLYWFAELPIPPYANKNSVLHIKLDAPAFASLPYERLFFAFDDFAMPIENNVAALTLDEFREQFKKGGVALLFSSEGETKFVESPGSLRLLNFEEFARRQELQSPEQASVAE